MLIHSFLWKSSFAATPKMVTVLRNGHQTLETALINERAIYPIQYHMSEYFPPPPDYITTHEDVLST